jgi:hypothetical protein
MSGMATSSGPILSMDRRKQLMFIAGLSALFDRVTNTENSSYRIPVLVTRLVSLSPCTHILRGYEIN